MSSALKFPARASTAYAVEDAPLPDVPRLLSRVRAQVTTPGYRPPMLPAVALQVHALSRRADSSLDDILEVLERDSMLAADVLRRACAADVAGRTAPKSLRDAAMRLGTRGLGAFVLDVAMNGRIFRVPGLEEPLAELQRHSTRVAASARLLAGRTRAAAPDAAELAGILHDVGVAACLHVVGATGRDLHVAPDVLAEVARRCEAEVTRVLLGIWKLPREIASAIERHDNPIYAVTQSDGTFAEAGDPLAACVTLGNLVAGRLQEDGSAFAVMLGTPSDRGIANALRVLGLTVADVEAVQAEAASLLGLAR